MSWRKKLLYSIIAIGLIVSAKVYYDKQEQENLQKQMALQAALEVSVLPDGVETAWFNYIEQKLQLSVQHVGSQYRLFGAGVLSSNDYVYVSTNTPYVIECNRFFGGSIVFGSGDGSHQIVFYGVFSRVSGNGPAAPDILVHKRSEAAKELYEGTCAVIAEYMSELDSKEN